MDLQPNKTDGIYLPITNTRISASEWNQLVGSCMAFITEAGLTPDASDNEQFLNAFKTIAAGLEIVGANTNLSNLTATGEARFTTKADTDLMNVSATSGFRRLVEVYKNGTSWYKVFDEYDPNTGNFVGKWCEQGSKSVSSSNLGHRNVTISLLKPYIDTNYSAFVTSRFDGQTTDGSDYVWNETTTQFTVHVVGYGYIWSACGYIS